ncbi:MAG: class I adenylate-forming enzyme family protein [Acidimicrobiales bacterium]
MDEPRASLAEVTAAMTAPGELFETERARVGDVEMTVWRHAPRSLRDVLESSRRHGERDFLVYGDQRMSFDEHYRVAATLAQRLSDEGVGSGTRVALIARNLPEWVSAFWGAAVLGALVVPLNAWWSADELRYGLTDSASAVAFVDAERLERVLPFADDLDELTTLVVLDAREGAALPTLGRVRVVGFPAFLGEVRADATPPEVAIEPDDDATMFYTSGTTGRPKGAVSTHRNIVTNLMNLFFISQRAARRFPSPDTADAPNAALLTIPLFHATGCLAVMVVNVAAGGRLVMMHHFDPARALELIASEHLTMIGGVPTVVMQLLDHPDFARYDTSSVRSVSYGGAPAPPELVRRIRAAFPLAQPGNGYGLTETSAALALNTGPDYVARPTSCGPPVPVCDVAIVPEGYDGLEPPDDRPRGPEVVGELWVRGPNVVRGYWGRPDETATAFTRGWLHTGDLARLDDEGYLYIVDRAKDVIIRGGENVYSIVVEAALFEHPDVADCAVVGLPHPTLGEEVAAVIVLRPGRRVDAEEFARHLTTRIARFEVPTRYFFRADPLPRNPQGKVLKRELRSSLVP